MVIADFTSFDESVAIQIVLSNAGCPAVVTTPPATSAAGPPLRVGRIVRP
jgi:hypothetical protein